MHDAAGVVPGAEVTAINEETNVSRSTTTNEAGEYNLPDPNAAPGPTVSRNAGRSVASTGSPSPRPPRSSTTSLAIRTS